MASAQTVWEKALLSSVSDAVRPRVREALSARSAEAARDMFRHWLGRYCEVELARPCEGIAGAHEFGGHLRPLFARPGACRDEAFIAHCLELFAIRRRWAGANLHHGYCDGHEVHHEPETFLYFQIPLLDMTGNEEVLASVEDVAAMAGNWAEGIPDWYDWEAHGFRSTWLGSREVRARHPDDYQEANHWRIVAIVLAAHRQGAGAGRYLELARDYAERWAAHVERRRGSGRPISMQILPEGGVLREMGHAGVRQERIPEGVYVVFYRQVAPNTAFDVGQGLQDVFRLTGDERFLDAAGAVIDQFRDHADPATGRWAVACSQDEWTVDAPWSGEAPPLGHPSSLLARLVLRQEALQPCPERRRDLTRWAEAVFEGDQPLDAGAGTLLLAASVLTGDERFRTEGRRRLTAGLAAVFDNADGYHCCSGLTRPGYGFNLDLPWLIDANQVEGGTRGSWPLPWPEA